MDRSAWWQVGALFAGVLIVGCGDDSVATSASGSESDGTTAATTSGGTTSGGSTSEGSTGGGSATEGETSGSSGGSTSSASATTGSETTGTTGTTGVTPSCGDGVIDEGELCDDGDANADEAACKLDCTPNVCGDGALHEGVEACDDGNVDDEDGCSSLCAIEACGDGVLQEGLGEACDDGNVDDEDGCSSACAIESCGDGILQVGLGEACDDGNNEGGDGCDAECQEEPQNLCPGGKISILVNYDFETGSFAPWTSNGNPTITASSHSGAWAAQTIGNFHVQQDFAATPVSSLVSATFWTWHDSSDSPAMSVQWGYSDNSTGSTFFGANQLNGWQQHNILANLAANKSLVWIRVWGYSGGGNLQDIARYDDFAFCRNP
ncbi:MAG: DUF4215 domain-containing protein [Myxococcales bacterium]|nr:DUF4215 domain-containing protein [Myxococcales bacterium]